MRKSMTVLLAAACAGALATVVFAHVGTQRDMPSSKEEYSVVKQEQSVDDDYSTDLEEPFIEGDPPATAREFAKEATDEFQTVKRRLVEQPGDAVGGEGWSATER